jgi:hypothetical protein
MPNKVKHLIAILFIFGFITSVSAAGTFHFEIIRDGNKEHEQYADYLEEKGTFEKIITALNETLNIPYDINIIMTNRKGGSFYSHKKKTILLDYGTIQWSQEQYDLNHPDSDKQTRQYYLNNINLFNFYHELAHALIDAYNFDIIEQEEDAADNLAAVMILYYFKKGDLILLDVADYFNRISETQAPEEKEYWSTHGLSEQRYYQLLCYAYAKSPTVVAEKLQEEDDDDHTLSLFIENQKDSCIYQYQSLNRSWFTLLKPHFKNGEQADKAIEEIN